MARFSARLCYALNVPTLGREAAARDMARLFAERLRNGIDTRDAADLAAILDRVADGASLSIALGFTVDGRPHEFERDLEIYKRVEELHATLPLATCYARVAGDGLSAHRVKSIHLKMRRAYWEATHPEED